MKEKWELAQKIIKEHEFTTLETVLVIADVFLLGVLIGMLVSPRKNKMFGCYNGSYNGSNNKDTELSGKIQGGEDEL